MYESGLDDLRDNCEEIRKRIFPQMNKKLNMLFEKDSPDYLVPGAEAFTGLIRGTYVANNIDVELYFQSHEKLDHKMKKIINDVEGRNWEIKNVNKHQETLQRVIGSIKSETYISPFQDYILWAIEFAKVAEKILRAELEKKEIKRIEDEIKALNLELQRLLRIQKALKENGVHDFYSDIVGENKKLKSAWLKMAEIDGEE